MHYPSICLEGLSKIMQTSENIAPNRESNSESPDHYGEQPPDCDTLLDLSETDYDNEDWIEVGDNRVQD
jgi:hypothetical protein